MPQHPIRHRVIQLAKTWGPVALMMAAIFFASAQPGLDPGIPRDEAVQFRGLMPTFAGSWEFLIKKGSHVLSYAVLALLLMRAFRRSDYSLREAGLLAMLVAMTYALTDELHQGFVPGRRPAVLDLGFDYTGAATALLLRGWWLARHPAPASESTRAPRRERAASSRLL